MKLLIVVIEIITMKHDYIMIAIWLDNYIIVALETLGGNYFAKSDQLYPYIALYATCSC